MTIIIAGFKLFWRTRDGKQNRQFTTSSEDHKLRLEELEEDDNVVLIESSTVHKKEYR